MIHFLTAGTLLGLSAGFAPGPLLALVISETLRHDIRAGVRVALAPLITDLPIVILTLFALGSLSRFDAVLGTVSLLGAMLVLYLGIGSMRGGGAAIERTPVPPRSLTKGILVNLMSPHPYLFWFSIGAPIIIKAWQQTAFDASAFVVSFYVFLIGAKVLLAVLVGRSRDFLAGRTYGVIMKLLGVLLIGFACVLFRDGLQLLGYLK